MKLAKAFSFFVHFETEDMARTKAMIRKEMDKIESIETAAYVAILPLFDSISMSVLGETDVDIKIGSLDGEVAHTNHNMNYVCVDVEHICKAFYEKDVIIAFDELLDTLYHESRHVWQFRNGWDFVRYTCTSQSIDKYRNQRCEVDARRYAKREVFALSVDDKEAMLRRVLTTLLWFNNK